jgi:putative DNA primase/helicase
MRDARSIDSGAAFLDAMAAKIADGGQALADATAPGTDNARPRDDSPLTPPQMRPEGFPPLLKEICDAACENSEAHPVAVAFNVLLFFCAMVGRTAFQRIGDAVIHCRLYGIIAGKSGKARKGTSETLVRLLFSIVDTKLDERIKSGARLRIHAGGLSTGEGIAYAIRDAKEPDDAGKGADAGIADKRLLVLEAEFATTLACSRREGSTLSPTVRNLWDGRDIEPLTKTATTRASRPHVVIGGHITGQELREKATEGDTANGLLNRFMVLFVYRPKLVPLPKPTRAASIEWLAQRLTGAVMAATGGNLHGNCEREVRLGDEASELWCEMYPHLTRDREGKIGSLLARTEVYARMLAMVFALLDSRDEIEPCDLRAAMAWIDYWAESAAYVFRTGDGEDDQVSEFESEVLDLIRAQPGITLTAIQRHWHNNKVKPVKAALERLTSMAPPLIVARKEAASPGNGRAPMRYWAG